MSVAPSLRKINFFSLSFSVPICCCKYKLSVDLLTHCEFWSLKKTKCDNKKVLQFSVWSCLTPFPIFLRNLLWLTTMLYLGQTKFFLEKNYCMLCALDIISCVDIIFIYIKCIRRFIFLSLLWRLFLMLQQKQYQFTLSVFKRRLSTLIQ